MPIQLSFGHEKHSDQEINQSLNEILENTVLLSMATITAGGEAYINNAMYAYTNDLQLVFQSEPSTVHAQNLKKNPSIAVAVADTHQTWDRARRGLQIFGTAHEARDEELKTVIPHYFRRFPGMLRSYMEDGKTITKKTAFYIIHVERIKVFDEKLFGREYFFEVKLPKVDH